MEERGKHPAMSELIASLFDSDRNVVEEAQFDLEHYGAKPVPAVLEVLPSLGVFGQRCAMEFIQKCDRSRVCRIKSPSVTEVMIPLLKSDDDVVREWAAHTLGWLRAFEAIPELLTAQQTAKDANIPLDWTEQAAYRDVLTHLGHRKPRVPVAVRALAQTECSSLGRYWPAEDLRIVIEALTEEGQVVLCFQLWVKEKSPDGTATFLWKESPNYDLDLKGPWHKVVENSRKAASAAEAMKPPKNAVVSLEWIDESDR